MPSPIASEAASCVMCGTVPRHRPPGASPLLCGSILCAHRYAALPTFTKCSICQRPLEKQRWGIGSCARISCELAAAKNRPPATAARHEKARKKRATALRNRHALKRGMSHEERSTFHVAVLPLNLEQPSPLPAHRRAALEQHLRAKLAEAKGLDDDDPSPSIDAPLDDRTEAERVAEGELLGAGCASCRGHCCREGENHAYITADTLRSYRRHVPDYDDEMIIDAYLARVRDETMTHGCIFQHETGCTLRREMRSYTCNAFFCAGMRGIRATFEAGAPVRAFFVHECEGRLSGAQFVSITVRGRHD